MMTGIGSLTHIFPYFFKGGFAAVFFLPWLSLGIVVGGLSAGVCLFILRNIKSKKPASGNDKPAEKSKVRAAESKALSRGDASAQKGKKEPEEKLGVEVLRKSRDEWYVLESEAAWKYGETGGDPLVYVTTKIVSLKNAPDTNRLAALEQIKEELKDYKEKEAAATITRRDILEYASASAKNQEDYPVAMVVRKKTRRNEPDILRCGGVSFAFIFEKSGGLDILLRMTAVLLRGRENTISIVTADFPDDGEWVHILPDPSADKDDILEIVDKCYRFILNGYFTQDESGKYAVEGDNEKYELYVIDQISRINKANRK